MRVFCGAIYLLGLLHWLFFLDFGNLPFTSLDWPRESAYLAVLREAVSTLTMPYHNYFEIQSTLRFLGIPDTPLTPDIALLPVLSDGAFIVIHVILLYTIGFLGTLALAEQCDWTRTTTALFFLLFNFNGNVTAHIAVGHTVWTGYFLLPIFISFTLRWLERGPVSVDTIGLGLIVFSFSLLGAFHFCIWGVLFLLLLGLRRGGWFRTSLLIAAFSAILTAYRWLPAAVTFQRHSWPDSTGFATIPHMLSALVFRNGPSTEAINDLAWWEYDMYVGVVGSLVILVCGIIPQVRHLLFRTGGSLRALNIPLACFLVFPYRGVYGTLFSRVPVFGAERVTTRILTLPLAFLIALACTHLNQYFRREGSGPRLTRWAIVGLVIVVIELGLHSWTWQVSSLPISADAASFGHPKLVHKDDPDYKRAVNWGMGLSMSALLLSLGYVLRRQS